MSFRNLKVWLSSAAFRKAPWLDVLKFTSIEMIRDGGSFALKFEGREGNQYILFTKIRFANVGPPRKDEHGYSREREVVGYEKPVIIDSDPPKRPQNTRPAFIANCVDLQAQFRGIRPAKSLAKPEPLHRA